VSPPDSTPAPTATPPAGRDAIVLGAGLVLFLGLLAYSHVWRLHGPLPAVVALLLAGGLTAILRAARVAPAVIVVVLGGLGLQVVYFGWTGALHRNTDASSQLEYIEYILAHHALPSNGTCLVCHHPPLYYLLAAAVRRGLELAHVTRVDSGLQAFSQILFSVFVLFSTLTIQRLAEGRLQRILATALVMFWPYTIINSVRIHNDTAFYAVAAATLYPLVRWAQEGGSRRLILACALALVGLGVKSNAAILVALILLVVAWRTLRAPDRRAFFRRAAPLVGVFLCAAVAVSLARGERGAGLGARVLGNAYHQPGLTPRSLRYYLTFSPSGFVARPFASIRLLTADSEERTYWNHLLKSSLHGTRNPVTRSGVIAESPILARASNWALLVLTGALLLGLLLTVRASSEARTITLLAIGAYVLTGVAFHLLVPVGHHADFRLIYPVLVPMSLLYVQVVGALRARRVRPWPAWVVVAAAFVAVSVSYHVPSIILWAQARWRHHRFETDAAPPGKPPHPGRVQLKALLARPPALAPRSQPAPRLTDPPQSD
jgi:hypothetical protein